VKWKDELFLYQWFEKYQDVNNTSGYHIATPAMSVPSHGNLLYALTLGKLMSNSGDDSMQNIVLESDPLTDSINLNGMILNPTYITSTCLHSYNHNEVCGIPSSRVLSSRWNFSFYFAATKHVLILSDYIPLVILQLQNPPKNVHTAFKGISNYGNNNCYLQKQETKIKKWKWNTLV
jgi:hypothetical protein